MRSKPFSAYGLVGVVFLSALFVLSLSVPTLAFQAASMTISSRAPAEVQPFTTPAVGSEPRAVNATWENYQDTLILPPGGSLYLFAQSVATSSAMFATPFSHGELANASSAEGSQEAALAATEQNYDSYSTNANHYSIAGAEIFGNEVGSPVIQAETPPVEPTVYLNVSFTVSADAFVVFVLTAGGQCCLTASGIPGLTILALESFAGGNAIEIAQANLTTGQYTIEEQSYNHDAGGTTWANLVGVFQFSQSAGSSTSDWTWVLVAVGTGAALVVVAAVVFLRLRPKSKA